MNISGKPAIRAGVLWAVGVVVGLLFWRSSHWWLSGDDGYFHIRIAADLREQGKLYFQSLDWVRLSVFRDGWGDKEFLFHVLLLPFAGTNLLLGAKTALSLLNGTIAGLLAYLGVRHAGSRGWLVPLLAVAMTAGFAVRMEQLRPHLLSLILLLLIAACIAERKKAWLGVLHVVYALSYTAWHLPIILSALAFPAFLVLRKERRWELLWIPISGIALGVVLHPGFPDNARIWALQNIQFFVQKDGLPVGTEIFGRGVAGFIIDNWRAMGIVALGAVLLWPLKARERASTFEITVGVFTAATTALYLTAIRFAEYAIPFLALYLVVLASRLSVGRTMSKAKLALLTMVMVAGASMSLRTTATVVGFNHYQNAFASPEEVEQFRRALPPGARVAAAWDFTPFYYYAAPHARYLNVLDPIFMWKRHSAEHDMLERMLVGERPDVPAVLSDVLGSDYIAYHHRLFPVLHERILGDPEMTVVYESTNHTIARVRAFPIDSSYLGNGDR